MRSTATQLWIRKCDEKDKEINDLKYRNIILVKQNHITMMFAAAILVYAIVQQLKVF